MFKFLPRSHGFTLVELMITVSIAGILTAMAVPSFSDAIRNYRLTTAINDIFTSLNMARSEAIKRGVQVTLARSGATSLIWTGGWQIYVDIGGAPSGNALGVFMDDGDGTPCEADSVTGTPLEDCLLQTHAALADGLTLRTGSNFADTVTFNGDGFISQADTFRLCDAAGDTLFSRSIVVSLVGRPRISTPASGCP